MSVEIIKELPVTRTGAKQVLVKRGHEYYVVSSVHAYSGFETLVFPADANGEVTDYCEVAGGRGMSREEAIEDLSTQEKTA